MEKYASFGVLVFELRKGDAPASDVKTMNLRLVQSVARFSADGKVQFYLAESADREGDPLAGLKFEPRSPGGVSQDAFGALHPLGSGTFKKVETGDWTRSSSSRTRRGGVS